MCDRIKDAEKQEVAHLWFIALKKKMEMENLMNIHSKLT